MIKHIFKLIWNKRKSNTLILIEIFLAFLVLFAVLSYVTYNYRMFQAPLGFQTQDKWLVALDNFKQDSLEIVQLKSNLRSELMAMDNVQEVSFMGSGYPFSGNTSQSSGDKMGFNISSLIIRGDNQMDSALGMNLVQGRWFNEEDYTSTYPPMVVNQAFMDAYFSDKDMLDSLISFIGENRLVGVVDAYRYKGEFAENEPTIFLQNKPHNDRSNFIVLNMTSNTPAAYEEGVFNTIKSITKSENFIIQHLDKSRQRSSVDTWVPMIVLMCICGFLCINVALGLLGVLWYNINKRRGEIGLRRAIGAHSSDITKQFVLEIVILALLAITLGVFFAIQVPLLELGPLEPINMYWAIALSAAIILFLVVICALQPSWQASKIHPATALHEE